MQFLYYGLYRVGIITHDNRFYDMLTHRINSDRLQMLHNVPAFDRTLTFRTINKHFIATFMNICFSMLGWIVLEVFIAIP